MQPKVSIPQRNAPTADAHKSPPHRSSLHIPKQYRIKFEADPKQRSQPKTAKFGSVAARMTMPDSSDCLVREFPPWPLATCCPARRYPLWHQWHYSAASAAWSGPARPCRTRSIGSGGGPGPETGRPDRGRPDPPPLPMQIRPTMRTMVKDDNVATAADLADVANLGPIVPKVRDCRGRCCQQGCPGRENDLPPRPMQLLPTMASDDGDEADDGRRGRRGRRGHRRLV